MYYYSLAKLTRKDRVEHSSQITSVCERICGHLISKRNPLFDQDPQSEEYDFTSGIQVAGLITYSSKIIRRDKLGENQVSLITRAIEERHKLATTEN